MKTAIEDLVSNQRAFTVDGVVTIVVGEKDYLAAIEKEKQEIIIAFNTGKYVESLGQPLKMGVDYFENRFKADKMKGACFISISVDDELPNEATFYNCIVTPSKFNLNNTANVFFDGNRFAEADEGRKVTHWLKQIEHPPCNHKWFRTTKNHKPAKKCTECGEVIRSPHPEEKR